jgi:NADPH:quinone reductase-like Zn-dependent oxidoreductase
LGGSTSGGFKTGQEVLIIGASGSIGSAGVQLAKHFGTIVTAVCSGGNVELVRSLGADNVIDYTKEDFTKNATKYDLIFDIVGATSFDRCQLPERVEAHRLRKRSRMSSRDTRRAMS